MTSLTKRKLPLRNWRKRKKRRTDCFKNQLQLKKEKRKKDKNKRKQIDFKRKLRKLPKRRRKKAKKGWKSLVN
jgi:hypothetical protein